MMSESVVGTCVFVFIMEGTGVYYNVCVCVCMSITGLKEGEVQVVVALGTMCNP